MGARVEAVAKDRRRAHAALVSSAFFLGVVLSLLALGTAASHLGRLLAGWSVAFAMGAATVSRQSGSMASGVLRSIRPGGLEGSNGFSSWCP